VTGYALVAAVAVVVMGMAFQEAQKRLEINRKRVAASCRSLTIKKPPGFPGG
jgi:hypothetical protein